MKQIRNVLIVAAVLAIFSSEAFATERTPEPMQTPIPSLAYSSRTWPENEAQQPMVYRTQEPTTTAPTATPTFTPEPTGVLRDQELEGRQYIKRMEENAKRMQALYQEFVQAYWKVYSILGQMRRDPDLSEEKIQLYKPYFVRIPDIYTQLDEADALYRGYLLQADLYQKRGNLQLWIEELKSAQQTQEDRLDLLQQAVDVMNELLETP